MVDDQILNVIFFQTTTGREPVREWLKEQDRDSRRAIGEDIKLVQFRWPLGLPLVRKMEPQLWEVRTNLSDGRIARTFFLVSDRSMVLLHGFIKKSQKTPPKDLEIARRRKRLWLQGEK